MRGVLQLGYQSFWERIAGGISHWWVNEGRFFPISAIEGNVIFYLLESVTAYKIFQFTVVVTAVLLLVRIIGSDCSVSNLLLLILLTGAFGFRNWYDPTLMFNSILPSTAVKIFLVLLSFRKYHQSHSPTKRKFYLTIAFFLWFLAILQYEIIIGFLPIILTPVMIETPRHCSDSTLKYCTRVLGRARAEVTLMMSTVVYLIVYLIIRPSPKSAAYQASFDSGAFFETYFKQLSGSIPGISLFLAGELSIFHFYLSCIIILPVTVVLIFRTSNIRLFNDRRLFATLVIALTFTFVSPISAAISPRWQDEVHFGYAYLSVFFQYLGVGLLLSIGVDYLIKHKIIKKTIAKACLATVLTVLVACSHANLIETVRSMRPTNTERNLLINSLSSGSLAQAGSTIVNRPLAVVSQNYNPNLFVNELFFSMHGVKPMRVFNSVDDCADLCADSYLVFSITYNSSLEGDETIKLSTEAIISGKQIAFPEEFAMVKN